MKAIDRLFLSSLVKSAFGMGPSLARLNPQLSSSVADLGKHLTTEGGNYNLDVFDKPPYHKTLPDLNPAFTNNMRTLLINAHGGERGLVTNRVFGLQSNPYPSVNDPKILPKHHYLGMNRFNFSLPDVAKLMGPRTNDIHNLILSACGSGGCAPGEAFKLFPNLTNVVSSWTGDEGTSNMDLTGAFGGWSGIGNSSPQKSTIKRNVGLLGPKLITQKFDIDKMLNRTR